MTFLYDYFAVLTCAVYHTIKSAFSPHTPWIIQHNQNISPAFWGLESLQAYLSMKLKLRTVDPLLHAFYPRPDWKTLAHSRALHYRDLHANGHTLLSFSAWRPPPHQDKLAQAELIPDTLSAAGLGLYYNKPFHSPTAKNPGVRRLAAADSLLKRH